MREALQQWKARFRLRRWDRHSCRPPRQMTGKNACPTELILCALAAPEFEELANRGRGHRRFRWHEIWGMHAGSLLCDPKPFALRC